MATGTPVPTLPMVFTFGVLAALVLAKANVVPEAVVTKVVSGAFVGRSIFFIFMTPVVVENIFHGKSSSDVHNAMFTTFGAFLVASGVLTFQLGKLLPETLMKDVVAAGYAASGLAFALLCGAPVVGIVNLVIAGVTFAEM